MTYQGSGIEVEEYLVAGLMFCEDRQLFDRMTSAMRAEWFANLECREVFSYLSQADQEDINPNSMAATFEGNTTWKAERFRGWLCRLIDDYPPSTLGGSLIANAKLLAERYRQRVFLEIAGTAVMRAEDNPHGDYVGPLEVEIEKLKRIGVDYKDELFSNSVLDLVDKMESGLLEESGIASGIRGLDARAGTMKPGDLVVVGARPAVGKSMFGVVCLMNAAREGKRVYLASMEMEKSEIVARLISNEAGAAMIPGEKSTAIREAAFRVSSYDIHIDDRSTMSVADVAARVHEIGDIDLIVVDYLQLLAPTEKTELREQQVSSDTRALKRLAGDIKAPLILMSQLNRKAAEGVPQLSHLRESGAIEQDANKVYLLDRELDGERMDIYIRKNRSGRQGLVEVTFQGECSRINEGVEWSP